MSRDTVFSPCRMYRYSLWREFDMGNPSYAMFVGLNPSTATEVLDDNTIRRCISFAKIWGFGALCMTNLFAYRTKDPAIMKAAPDPIGPDNDTHLAELADGAGIIIAAWGVHGRHRARDVAVCRLLPPLHCLGLTKDEYPKHPLYLPKSATPILFTVAAEP